LEERILLSDREVALRLATNRDVDRKLRIASSSRYFWIYSLSLWDPDAFWKCVSGAAAFAFVGLLVMRLTSVGLMSASLTAAGMFEYFLLGLILMWVYSLGPWLHPTNLLVIFTFIFRLYRRNMTIDDLSAEEIGRLFPTHNENPASAEEHPVLERLYRRIRQSPVLGSLVVGSSFAAFMILLLLITS
jgi:hypothetical protein